MAPLSRHAGRLGRVPAPSARRLVLLVAFLTVAALILRPDLIVVVLLGGILLAGLVAALSRLTAYLDWVARRMPATAGRVERVVRWTGWLIVGLAALPLWVVVALVGSLTAAERVEGRREAELYGTAVGGPGGRDPGERR